MAGRRPVSSTRELPATRRERILAMVKQKGFTRIAEVAETLGISPITARRDIAQLTADGLVQQERGGARALPGTAPEPQSHPGTGIPAGATVGLIVPSLRYYWPAVVRGVGAAADSLGVRLLIQSSAYRPEDSLRQARSMVGDGIVSGLLLAPEVPPTPGVEAHEDLLAFLETIELPTVLVERALRPHGSHGRTLDSASSDHRMGGIIAARHLADLGHKHVALFSHRSTPTQFPMRKGWEEAVDDLGLDSFSRTTSASFPPTPGTEAAGVSDVDRFIDECVKRGTTALLAHSDELALTVVQRLMHRGLRVPADISVIAYDDEVAALARPALTAIAPPKEAIGDMALRMLVERIGGSERPITSVELQPSLIDRGSTAPPGA